MSKLDIIETALKLNRDARILEVHGTSNLPAVDFPSSTMDFWVAPTQGLYSAEELQQFMDGLIPAELERSTAEKFVHERDRLTLGRLWFDEPIGKASIAYVITDPRLMNERGIINGIHRECVELVRRTIVSVFPCAQYIEDLRGGKLKGYPSVYWIENSDLQRYSGAK